MTCWVYNSTTPHPPPPLHSDICIRAILRARKIKVEYIGEFLTMKAQAFPEFPNKIVNLN